MRPSAAAETFHSAPVPKVSLWTGPSARVPSSEIAATPMEEFSLAGFGDSTREGLDSHSAKS
jgi:hypothetical protein